MEFNQFFIPWDWQEEWPEVSQVVKKKSGKSYDPDYKVEGQECSSDNGLEELVSEVKE